MESRERLHDQSEYEALRDLFQFCLNTDLLTEEERAHTLQSVAHRALTEGTFDVFAELYDGDAWEEFVGSKTSAEKLRIVENSLHYSVYPAYRIADRFTDDMHHKDRKKAHQTLGRLAAKEGDVYDLYRYAPKTAEEYEKELAYTFIEQERWEELSDLATYERLDTYTIIYAAKATAKAGRFDDALAYLNKVTKQNLAPHERADPGTGSWFNDALVEITESAFVHDQLNLIADLPTIIKWPKDVDVNELINHGIQRATWSSGNHDAAIVHYIDVALQAGEDAKSYTTLLRALEENNWDVITIIAPQLNSEVLSFLQAKARFEKNMTVSKELLAVSQQRTKYTGHEIFFSDDTSPLIEDIADAGDWDQVLVLLPGAPKIWRSELMYSLADKAVAQDQIDVLLRLMTAVDSGPYYLSRFLDVLMSARKTDEANALYADMCYRASELPEQVQADLPWLKQDLLKEPALYAIEDGDYDGARQYLEELGNYIPILAATQEDGYRSDARAFELAGSMILKKIADNKLN
jgi:hypothetical protein